MTAQASSTAHRILTWVSGIGTILITAVILNASGAFMDMRDTLIRMERIPGTVDTHEQWLRVHDNEINDLQRKP